jgi:CheY-like chemotaxis protein
MQKSVLLVDDDPDDAELFCEGLAAADPEINCHAARNGKEALDLLQNITLPGLIFLDLNMPIMNGWDCLKVLKGNDRYQHIPVVMYSTSSNKKEIEMAADMGAIGFITKPDDFGELKRILKNVAEEIAGGSLGRMFSGRS